MAKLPTKGILISAFPVPRRGRERERERESLFTLTTLSTVTNERDNAAEMALIAGKLQGNLATGTHKQLTVIILKLRVQAGVTNRLVFSAQPKPLN